MMDFPSKKSGGMEENKENKSPVTTGDGCFNTSNYYASLMDEDIPRGLEMEEGNGKDEIDKTAGREKGQDCPLEEKAGTIMDNDNDYVADSIVAGREITPEGKREYRGSNAFEESTKGGEKSGVGKFLLKNRNHAEEAKKVRWNVMRGRRG